MPTGSKNLPCARVGASGLVAANKELSDPSSGVTVGMIFSDSCINVPRKEGSLPCRFVTMMPGCKEYAVTPDVVSNHQLAKCRKFWVGHLP